MTDNNEKRSRSEILLELRLLMDNAVIEKHGHLPDYARKINIEFLDKFNKQFVTDEDLEAFLQVGKERKMFDKL